MNVLNNDEMKQVAGGNGYPSEYENHPHEIVWRESEENKVIMWCGLESASSLNGGSPSIGSSYDRATQID